MEKRIRAHRSRPAHASPRVLTVDVRDRAGGVSLAQSAGMRLANRLCNLITRHPLKRLPGLCLGLSVMSVACLPGAPPTEPFAAHAKHVLFVGNSLTNTNDLPRVFQDLAIAGGYDVGVTTLANANAALIDYAYDASAMTLVGRGTWDFVVLQQGTTSVAVCRDTLVLAARLMDPYIRRGGGVPALMMSWPSAHRQQLFPNVHDSFALAAQKVDGMFLPVGDAWLEAWKVNSQHGLYGGDGYHQSKAGTYLAALVIYKKLTGKDARALPTDLRVGADKILLPVAQVRQLQEAAHAANASPVSPVVMPATPVVAEYSARSSWFQAKVSAASATQTATATQLQ